MLEHGYHDLGGRPAGKVDRSEHGYAEWERRVDALAVLLWALKGGTRVITVDEHRKNIEALPPDAYDQLSYYEKWIVSLTQCLIQRGVITTAELGQKMSEVEKRG